MLSHSLGSSSAMWQAQLESLGDRYRLLLFDHRGHGRSDLPETAEGWTMVDFGTDLLAVLDELELERVHVCGLSLGGMVGLWLAEKAPWRLGRLIVANTSAFTENPELLRARIALIKEQGVAGIVDDVLDRWFTRHFHHSKPDEVGRFRDGLLNTPDVAYLATSEAICAMDLRPGLGEIDVPVLVIAGREDRATPAEWGERIATAIPSAEYRVLEAAHLSNVEASSGFSALVLEFLGGNSERAQPDTA